MAPLNPDVMAWMRAHHATISSAALDDHSVSLDQRRRLVAAGVLVRVADGSYGLGAVELDERAVAAALCAARPELVVAGPTAGGLWGLRRSPRDGLVHVIAPPASHPCREPWVKAYRTALIDPEDVVTHPDGLRLTSPSRTVVDLTRYVDPFALTSIVEHAISSGLCSETAMERTAARLATPGRSWARRFLRTLASRHPGAAAESEGELWVFRALVRAGAVALVRQHAITLPGYGPARFDMAIPPLRWALEVDLHPEHRTPEGRARDSLRDVAAEGLGWRVRRVGEVELDRRRLPATIAALVTEIERRRADVAALVGAGLWSPR